MGLFRSACDRTLVDEDDSPALDARKLRAGASVFTCLTYLNQEVETMATIITAPEQYQPAREYVHKVFLAGAIDMGAAVDWQAYVIQQLSSISHLVIMN